MQHNFYFKNEELIIRPLVCEDIESLRIMRNLEVNRKWFFFDKEIDKVSQIKWFENYLEKNDDYMFAVCLPNKPDLFVGAVALYNYDCKNNCFEIGRLLLDSPKMPRRHMSIDVVKSICDIAHTIRGGGII